MFAIYGFVFGAASFYAIRRYYRKNQQKIDASMIQHLRDTGRLTTFDHD